jgi:hypothetical protein
MLISTLNRQHIFFIRRAAVSQIILATDPRKYYGFVTAAEAQRLKANAAPSLIANVASQHAHKRLKYFRKTVFPSQKCGTAHRTR